MPRGGKAAMAAAVESIQALDGLTRRSSIAAVDSTLRREGGRDMVSAVDRGGASGATEGVRVVLW